jgi:hypothetical protein
VLNKIEIVPGGCVQVCKSACVSKNGIICVCVCLCVYVCV